MSTESDFDHGDKTALVCVDDQTCQKMIVSQLTDLGYKVHLGLFEEDVLLKLATYSYHVVVVYENFKGGSAQENPILHEMMKRSGSLRRETLRRPPQPSQRDERRDERVRPERRSDR